MEHLDHQDWKQIIIHSKNKNINDSNTKKTISNSPSNPNTYASGVPPLLS